MEEIDSAFETAKAIAIEVQTNLNAIRSEEDAKIQIINRLLIECLGWRHADIAAETAHVNGYSDYLLSSEGKGALLIEAKRQGVLDIQSAEKGKVRHLKISGSVLAKASLGIDQAANYAMPNGLPISVLTDGTAWVVFKTFVPGANYKTKEAIVFPSIEAILADFSTFFELLSKSGFRKKTYNKIFEAVHNPKLFMSGAMSAALPEEQLRINQKSEIAHSLDRIFTNFFSRLTGEQDDDMLIECFVESRESRFADYALEKMTASVLGNLSPIEKDVDEELNALIETVVEIDPDQQDSGQSIFIVGPTGAGKTTFLDRFFKKTLSTTLRRKCLVSKVNCLDSSGRTDVLLSTLTETLISNFEALLYSGGHPNFDQLRGLYHSEYVRRLKGAEAQLYNRDKGAFKEKFGNYLTEVVQTDREGYLKRILSDIVSNRRQLPIIVFDNIDEFSIEFKTYIFQFAQSLRRHAKHCLIIFPLTDKSAWSFSKTDIFGIYQTRSFFLPTPAPREVFRKRIDFLKQRLADVKIDPSRGTYFTSRGIRIEIRDLEAFAGVLENVFVSQDYAAQLLGELSNYNIRRTLALSKRVITSPVLRIEDLLRSYVTGADIAPSYSKFMNALLKGDWNAFKRTDTHEVLPIFDIDPELKQSPLLSLRVLSLLKGVMDSNKGLEERHLDVQAIVDYFDALGGYESATDRCLLRLLQAGLVEPYDTSVRDLSPNQKLAISFSGRAHLKLALYNSVFFEQMAVTTPLANPEIVTALSGYCTNNGSPPQMRQTAIRQEFAKYLLEEDSRHLSPSAASQSFDTQTEMLTQIGVIGGIRSEEKPSAEAPNLVSSWIVEKAVAVVDWFDVEKGFGFVESERIEGRAFLHIEKLAELEISTLSDGDEILCDIGPSSKGIQVLRVYEVQTDPASIQTASCTITRLFPERGYGFVRLSDGSGEAFFHCSLVPEASRSLLVEGNNLRVRLGQHRDGKGLQVKEVYEFL